MRLADGTLAGSTLTMDRALRNFMALGLPLAEAARRLSAAGALSRPRGPRPDRAGGRADLVVVDGAGELLAVYVEGEPIDLADG